MPWRLILTDYRWFHGLLSRRRRGRLPRGPVQPLTV